MSLPGGGFEIVAPARQFVHQQKRAQGHGIQRQPQEIGMVLPDGVAEPSVRGQGGILDDTDTRAQGQGHRAFGARDLTVSVAEELDAARVQPRGDEVGPSPATVPAV